MELPDIGMLDRRVAILHKQHLPNDRGSNTAVTVDRDIVWGKLEVTGSMLYYGTDQIAGGVTHRVYVRRYPNRTRPQDLQHVTELEIDGVRYRIKRVADVGGDRRFTVMDVEEANAVRSPRGPRF
ncbi:phage head closure protein [Sutterella sp.]|uniref:phage head closure protein n=1 Tax=Sutterella sp. TaxID=1981025 RepID=UPI0026DF8674|nr:phage head closure protein [Sutterella sp.]MDO5531420.1 phage head closure protein [Sutterella sp.]